METTNIVDFARPDGITDTLTERTEAGHAAVVRNGHHPRPDHFKPALAL